MQPRARADARRVPQSAAASPLARRGPHALSGFHSERLKSTASMVPAANTARSAAASSTRSRIWENGLNGAPGVRRPIRAGPPSRPQNRSKSTRLGRSRTGLVGVSPRTLEKHRIYGTGAGDAMTGRLIVLGTVAMAVAAIATTMDAGMTPRFVSNVSAKRPDRALQRAPGAPSDRHRARRCLSS